MNPLLMAALILVLSHQGNLNITRLDSPVKMNERVVNGSVVADVRFGWVDCEVSRDAGGKFVSGRVLRLVYTETPDPTNFAHEALHSVSCIHSGGIGGLLPFPPQTADPEHEFVYWCLANQPECIALIEQG